METPPSDMQHFKLYFVFISLFSQLIVFFDITFFKENISRTEIFGAYRNGPP